MSRTSTFIWGLVLTVLLGQVTKAKVGQWLGLSSNTRSPLIELLPFDANVALAEEEPDVKKLDVYDVPSRVSTSTSSNQNLEQVENTGEGNIQEEKADEAIAPPPTLATPSLTEPTQEKPFADSPVSSKPIGEPSSQFLGMQVINHCNGKHGNAHFRKQPTFASNAILGAVKAGDTVQLTGNQVFVDGIWWHEAIASTLHAASTDQAQNNLEPNQTGWIASCFVH